MAKARYIIHSTCFDKRGRVISSATNSYTSSCSLMRYYAMKAGHPEKKFNHSEILAIARAIKVKKTIASMLIVRYNSQGQFANCKPCPVCEYAIRDMGIKKVLYSTESGIKELII